eukprot:scaffold72282_cov57-Phaeocystis_antarctica.AAC.1
MTREEALQQAHAEGLVLQTSSCEFGYRGVSVQLGKPKPYRAQVSRGGEQVYLSFTTAEEAALCIARTQVAAEREKAVPPMAPPMVAPRAPLKREQVLQQAHAEGLALQKSSCESGYRCVYVLSPARRLTASKPYVVQVKRSGKTVQLGSFATVEEAALCFARSPEGRARAPPPGAMMMREQALQQARAEGLTLRKAANHTGYANVSKRAGGREHQISGGSKPYQASVRRSGEFVHLGDFATAEEAALCVAQSQVAAGEEALQQALAEGLPLQKADNQSGYANVRTKKLGTPKPYQALVNRGGEQVCLGSFDTAKEAALCFARWHAAAKEEAEEAAEAEEAEEAEAAEEAEEAAEAEDRGKHAKPGYFATAEEAVRCAARSPAEGQAGASLRKSSEGDTVEGEGMHKAATKPAVKEEMVPDAIVKEEGVPARAPLMPSELRWPDTVVKQEDEVVIDHEEHSNAQPAKKRKSPGQGMHGEHVRREHARGLSLQKKPRGRPPHGTDGLPMRWDGPKEAGRWV